ncbi:MAG TPA: hypothetical protein VLI39_21810 [Sedimentisphaerales bacterium]|nr:hypothetical protein [Sedimentisphaerales bacterium]
MGGGLPCPSVLRIRQAPAAPSIPAWVKGIKISGDFRYRHERVRAQTTDYDVFLFDLNFKF